MQLSKNKSDLETIEVEDGKFIRAAASEHGHGGVGLFIRRRASERLQSCHKVTDRIIIAHFEGNPILSVITVYASTNTSKNKNASESFYNSLADLTETIPAHNILVVAGDFNAQIGPTSHTIHPKNVGPYVHHCETNSNGERLASYCAEHKLCIAQSFFPHPPGRRWTHTRPKGNRVQLDHLLIRSE